MKKSDLPWILPLLTAWSQGKVLQFFSKEDNIWVDWEAWCGWGGREAPEFSGAESDYRIKPELKTPFQVYTRTSYPEFTQEWSPGARAVMERGINAVIAAYKNGELDLTGVEL